MAISPLNSVPKTHFIERRVIVDLSFPEGLAVNDGISKNYNNVLLHNQPNHLNDLKFEYHFFDR
jgi:hypothetical protein